MIQDIKNDGSKAKRQKFHPEIMTLQDIDDVAEIERICFGDAAWSKNSLELLTRDGIGMGLVCRKGGRVVAYAGMLCVVDEGQITNVATHPDFRRMGYASAIVDGLKRYAVSSKLDVITLEVRESNTAAIELYTRHGFKRDGKRRGFYTKPTEDAVLMSCKIR